MEQKEKQFKRKEREEKTFNFLSTDLFKACSSDVLRPAMMCVYFKDGYVYATDAHILIRENLKTVHGFDDEDCAALDGKLLDSRIVPLMKKITSFRIEEDGISFKNFHLGAMKVNFAEEKYPDAMTVLQQAIDRSRESQISESKIAIGLLKRLLMCLRYDYQDNVNAIRFYNGRDETKAITFTVESEYDNSTDIFDRVGIIMPTR